MESVIQQQVAGVAQVMESMVDAEIQRLDNLDSEDISVIRANRIKEMKKAAGKTYDLLMVAFSDLFLYNIM